VLTVPNSIKEPADTVDLRTRAVSRLSGHAKAVAQESAVAAFGVLHELAASPATAADALALLHELQVHQVEVELQAEELRASRAEQESSLRRQIQLYDAMPVGCFTIDPVGTMHELNLRGAALLESTRDALVGQSLYGFVTRESAQLLRSQLSQAGVAHGAQPCSLQLNRRTGDPQVVHAAVNTDPAGNTFLVTLMDAGQARSSR
jgi:PAS domain-containing protein